MAPYAARNFAHLYVVGGRQHSMGAVAEMQRILCGRRKCMQIQKETRRLILNDLIARGNIVGNLEASEFVRKVFPDAENMSSKDYRYTTFLEEVRKHMEMNNDWTWNNVLFHRLNLLEVDDDKFILFIEQYVSPGIRRIEWNEETEEREIVDNKVYVDAINSYLTVDGYELRENGQIANKPKYTVFPTDRGVQGQLKNIIFASSQKPDITFSDALNNEIRIERNEDKCLVYDKPIEGLITWKQLTDWYTAGNYIISRHADLVPFLQQSLSSPPEKLFFDSYLSLATQYAEKIPAIFPQVWLYYDPKLEKDRIRKIYEHQRMDFLMLFSESKRIVIEIDGIQHYADPQSHSASVDKYAAMVSAQRDMTLAGYEVYRFGGKELLDQTIGKRLVRSFLKELCNAHGVDLH